MSDRILSPIDAGDALPSGLHTVTAPDGSAWLSLPPRVWIDTTHTPGGARDITGRRYRRAQKRAARKRARR